MRKLKSNKKSKKALRKQAEKEVWIPFNINSEENQKLQLAMYLTNFAVVAGKHFDIWKRTDEEHGRCTDEVLMGKIQLMSLMAEQIRNEYLEDVDIRPTKDNIPIIAMTMGLCHECFGHTLPLSEEDKLQRLPAGFMATLGSMARTIQAIFDERFVDLQEKIGMLDNLNVLGQLVTQYLNYLHEEIIFQEKLLRTWDEKAMIKATGQMMVMLEKELEKGSFEDKELFKEEAKVTSKVEEKQPVGITMEEKHMKTDKELIKDMLEKEAKKVTKKKTTTKKAATKEVVEVPVVVEQHPENPSHYNQLGFNTIELIAGHLGKLGAFYFYLGNTFKYLLRAEAKNGKEDYIKAKQYLEWIVANEEVGETKAVDEILAGLETNWLNVSIALSGNMTGAKALLLNAIFESFFNKKYQIALDQLNLLLESE